MSYKGDKDSQNRPHGNGKYVWNDGSSYEGVFKSGIITGQGTYRWANGNIYQGDFINAERSGMGTFIYQKGDLYQGAFVQDRIHGQGIYWYSNGDRYQGSWYEGQSHGQGIFYSQSSNCFFAGTFENGKIRDGNWVHDGNMYRGPFVNEQFHGRGIYTFPTGRSKQANFHQGVLDQASAVEVEYTPAWTVPGEFFTAVPYPADILPNFLKNPRPIPQPKVPPGTETTSVVRGK